MDPGLWQIPTDPYEDVEPLAIKGPEEEEIDEGDKDGDEVDLREANKILDSLDLPNYDVEMRLAEAKMAATKQRNYYSPPGHYSRSPQRLRYPSCESSSHICHFPHRSLSNTCPGLLPWYSFYSHPQCPCMSYTSKLLLIKKTRNKKTSSKHVLTNFIILISFIDILISLIVYRPRGSSLEEPGNYRAC